MTTRHIAYTNRAKKELLALSEAMQRRVVAAIDELKSPDVSHKKVKKIKGRKKGEPPIYRVRAGNYRALYTVDENDDHPAYPSQKRRLQVASPHTTAQTAGGTGRKPAPLFLS